MKNIFKNFITIIKGSAGIYRSREVLTPTIREVDRPADSPSSEVENGSPQGRTISGVQDDKSSVILSDSEESIMDPSVTPQDDKGEIGTMSKTSSKSAQGRVDKVI